MVKNKKDVIGFFYLVGLILIGLLPIYVIDCFFTLFPIEVVAENISQNFLKVFISSDIVCSILSNLVQIPYVILRFLAWVPLYIVFKMISGGFSKK